ncbi:Phosphoribosylanthranilate isomerase [Alteripontixanthobacter maritimus]|uniref:N-(5'-phosphoribosyl)anthranilate isomerase n=1 Tax=Alteripontixanthobacter maritimus TaxID=2161824 RepID=A0A369Q9G3_9SPHN|nr:phosphoribosylanthranilate isomerase [Alteripontixanthobacter maritimus]RDC60195.1 Phosphoribosylanthranilate isomerase [Alteripontixanthobacter maritimus]
MIPDVKICGITTAAALDAAIAAQATHVGLNFYPPSPRFVDIGTATALAGRAAGRITLVGVFVEPTDQELAVAIESKKLDAIQLHGEESPGRVAEIRRGFGLPVWKALPVSNADDVASALRYDQVADFLLFDAKTPKGSALPGGMGLTFDWSLLQNYRGSLPWGLAGGLTPATVHDAVRETRTSLLDTSSGVESAPGVKDVDLIRAFCEAARTAG